MKRKIELNIIIPVYNEERDISECLSSLQKQSYKDFEIIIVDDGSTDRTKEIVKKSKKAKLIEGEHKGPGFSRNLGAKKAKGEILIFVDADMTFDREYLKNLTRPIIEGKTPGTSHGVEYASNLSNIWSKCWGKVRVDPKVKEHVIFRAIRKDIFLEKGGFDPRYGYADDQTFFFKYGMKSLAVPEAICYHKNPETLKQVYRQSRWIGASIDNFFVISRIIRYFTPFLMILFSPLAIPVLSLRKCLVNKDFLILPQMLVFMAFRYFGTVDGVYRRVFKNLNVR